MSEKTAVWKTLEGEGLEHFTLHKQDSFLHVTSTIIRVEQQSDFQLGYLLLMQPDYQFLRVSLALAGWGWLTISRDESGNWWNETDGKQIPLPELEGCIDVDITATPFTNTLPIRRLDWKVGQSEMFKMAWISVPEMTVTPNRQRYTCLEKSANGAKFHFESPDINFEAVITVDADGLVVDYPGLFKRVL